MSRTIDADAMLARLEEWNTSDSTDKALYNFTLHRILEQPTIEPRKKGRWIIKTIKKKIENDYSCSECGRHVSVMRGYDVRLVYPFCHCGAEMTEGEG